MPTSTLSVAAYRPPPPDRRASSVMVLVGDPGPVHGDADVPGWVRRCGWDVRWYPGAGPLAAAAAARLEARVLLLRPADAPRQHGGQDRPGRPGRPPRVVAALRGLPDDAPVVADAAACAARMGGALTLVHAVPRSFAERSVGLAAALALGRRLLDAATEQAVACAPGVSVDCRLPRVRPHELVGEALDADLLVVGGSRPLRPEPGLVAQSALHHAPCPVLVVERGPVGAARVSP
jgi:nucleotide-binding universal stress UspA family protein